MTHIKGALPPFIIRIDKVTIFKENNCIELPSLDKQRMVVFELATKEGISLLESNLAVEAVNSPIFFDESKYSDAHLLTKDKGWQPPDVEIVCYYLDQLKSHDSKYTGKFVANLLGIGDRRLREYKQGKHKFPYDTWRKLLIVTGRVPQFIEPVLVRFK